MKPEAKETNLAQTDSTWHMPLPVLKLILTIIVLLSSSSLLRNTEAKLWGVVDESISPTRTNPSQFQTSEGIVMATLGGFRSLIADIQWLKTMYSWEKEDKAKTIGHIQFTLSLDPRPTFFWLNGARMIAYDMRHWDIGPVTSPQELREEEIRLASLAIDLLKYAMQYHPETVSFPIEIAHIYLNRLGNLEMAAEYYHRAYTQYQEPPYYVGRLHALILAQMGRNEEAYKFLTNLFRELPSGDIYANKPLILQRIRTLEKRLNLPKSQRFRAQ